MSNRRRLFTVDEALAKLLEEEDDDFFGSGSDSEGEHDPAGRRGNWRHPSRASNSSGDCGDQSSGDEETHFLDHEVNVVGAASSYLGLDAGGRRCDHETDSDEGNEQSERGMQRSVQAGSQSTRYQCGCKKKLFGTV